VPAALDSLFDPDVQPYLISELDVDPAQEIAQLTIPILIVQGTTDTQVSVEDAMLLAGANARAKLLVVDGMAHELKAATSSPASQTESYVDPNLPVEQAVIDGIVKTVKAL